PGTDVVDIAVVVLVEQVGALRPLEEHRGAADTAEGADRRVDAAGNVLLGTAKQLFGLRATHGNSLRNGSGPGSRKSRAGDHEGGIRHRGLMGIMRIPETGRHLRKMTVPGQRTGNNRESWRALTSISSQSAVANRP